MPKVGTYRAKLRDGVQMHDIWYTSKEGFFLKTFNREMMDVVRGAGDNRIYHSFESESSLKEAYDDIIERYYKLISTERHCILIKLMLSSYFTMNKTGERAFVGHQKWFKQFIDVVSSTPFSTLKYCIGFEFHTGVIVSGKEDTWFDTTQDDTGAIISRKGFGRKTDTSKEIILNYSVELEQFLNMMGNQMHELAKKMTQFLTNQEKLLQAAASKQNLLTS